MPLPPISSQPESRTPELRFLFQTPAPVITVRHPDAAGNKFGFEGGSAVKVAGTYHLFTSEMVDNPMWVKMSLTRWVSEDRVTWKRADTIRTSSGDFTGTDPRAALWSPMVVWDPGEDRWNLFYVAYHAAPSTPEEMRLNMHGRIVRSVSETRGRDGIEGPFTDVGIILNPDGADDWEGLQGTDSFYPYQVGDVWHAFYGSCKTETKPPLHWLVGYAKSERPSIAGPWKRQSHRNPSTLEDRFIENPVVTKIAGGYLVIYAIQKPSAFGWAFSKDGIQWGKGQPFEMQAEPDTWTNEIRTVLGLIDEGDGRHTVFYTGFEQAPDWDRLLNGIGQETCAIGFVELLIG